MRAQRPLMLFHSSASAVSEATSLADHRRCRALVEKERATIGTLLEPSFWARQGVNGVCVKSQTLECDNRSL
jgi:hypothetical protein